MDRERWMKEEGERDVDPGRAILCRSSLSGLSGPANGR